MQFKTVEELIEWINQADIEDVTEMLVKHGFEFKEN